MRIYFMGIGGTAMGNGALLLRACGHEVMGCDQAIYPPMSQVLANNNITYWEGYDSRRLEALKPDCIVVGNALSRGNPEVEWLLQHREQRYTSLPTLLGELVLKDRLNVVVTGTHGKTTTTTVTAYLLKNNHSDTGYFIGGVPQEFSSGAYAGSSSAPFVIEGDEYDTAFFDKRSKFIHYLPNILLINNLEFDHADIFRDLEDIQRSFKHLLRIMPSNGYVIANGDDPHVQELLPISWVKHYTVGLEERNDLRIGEYTELEDKAQFNLYWKGALWHSVSWGLPGVFNARNAAMASLAAGLALHPENPTKCRLDALAHFRGVKRRQECLLKTDHIRVLEDFGHHPTALRETLHALKKRYPDRILISCFEPRSNTARMSVFQQAFTDSLSIADAIWVAPIEHLDKVPIGNRLDTRHMVTALNNKGKNAQAPQNYEEFKETLFSYIKRLGREKKVLVCFFSNGAFGGIIPSVVKMLKTIK